MLTRRIFVLTPKVSGVKFGAEIISFRRSKFVFQTFTFLNQQLFVLFDKQYSYLNSITLLIVKMLFDLY